jgi:mannose-6-phosphate isomerase class I
MHKKFRWSKVYESSEEELVLFLQSRNLQARRINADSMTEAVQQTAESERTLWCAEGSLSVQQESTITPLQPGDAVRVATNAPYTLTPGIAGYVCYVTD